MGEEKIAVVGKTGGPAVAQDLRLIFVSVQHYRESVAERIRQLDLSEESVFGRSLRSVMTDTINQLDDVAGRINVVIAALKEDKQ